MEDEAVEIVELIREYLKDFSLQTSSAAYNYYTENEFNNILMFQSEIKDKKEAYILEYLSSKFGLEDYQINYIYNKLYHAVFGKEYITEQEQKNDNDSEQKASHNRRLSSYSQSGLTGFNWNVTNDEINAASRYLRQHFPRLEQAKNNGNSGRQMIKIFTVGRKHGIDLLVDFFDIWSMYRHELRLKSEKAGYITFNEFFKDSSFVKKTMKKKEKDAFLEGYSFYMRKFAHVFYYNPLTVVNDQYTPFCNYAFALSQCLKDFEKELYKTKNGVPFQIDMWVIPRHAISNQNKGFSQEPMFDTDDETEDDDSDYAPDVDPDDYLNSLNCPLTEDTDNFVGKVEQRLDSAKVIYIKEIILHHEFLHNIKDKMKNLINFIVKGDNSSNGFGGKRLVMIIDRRDSASKTNKNSDRMYVFQPPKPYGHLKEGVCAQSFFNGSRMYMLPKMYHEQRPTHLSVLEDLKGRMFCLSFHIYHEHKQRAYFWLQSGLCTRFKPRYMKDLWPKFFFSDINRQEFEKMTQKVIDKNWKFDMIDDGYDAWYATISDRA